MRDHSFTQFEFVCLLPCPNLFLNFYWSAALSRPSWIFQKDDKEMVSATYKAKGNEILYCFERKYNPNVKENQPFKNIFRFYYSVLHDCLPCVLLPLRKTLANGNRIYSSDCNTFVAVSLGSHSNGIDTVSPSSHLIQ